MAHADMVVFDRPHLPDLSSFAVSAALIVASAFRVLRPHPRIDT